MSSPAGPCHSNSWDRSSFCWSRAADDGGTGSHAFMGRRPVALCCAHGRVHILAPLGGGYGDRLFACSSSMDAGDGIYTVDATGTFSIFRVFNNCNGMAFDDLNVLGDPGFPAPMLVDEGSFDVYYMAPDRSRTPLTSSLPRQSPGYHLVVPQSGAFAGRLYLVSSSSPDDPADGLVWYVESVTPWSTPVRWLTDLPEPRDAVFADGTPFGDVLLVTMGASGELRAYTPAGDFEVLVSGLAAPHAIALEPATGALFISERGTGQILRLTRP